MTKGLPGTSPRVPVDLTHYLEKAAEYDDIKKVVTQVSQRPLKGIQGYAADHISSCKSNNDTHSSSFNAGAGIALNDHFVTLVSWCGNKFGYSVGVDQTVCVVSKKLESLNHQS
ncbi:Glyceraldehyde-3-phosphate dehydrogenase [Galemys pyrenaicus]|uniref:Glyceraldehyde-3-phosphate dehydrogenase n=1 Tax=Galemys pyrenaicus TaxID=202257 RepID=A0A8J6AIJ3_GALPY|nr:Glyceraldehyde-3-phosphate dehydrogenase [Galemys pyrenaicus]